MAFVLGVLSAWNVPPSDICVAHLLADFRFLLKYFIETPFSKIAAVLPPSPNFLSPLLGISFLTGSFYCLKSFMFYLFTLHPLLQFNFRKGSVFI